MNTLIERAQDFAHRAHDSIGQVRKYTGAPYWVHTDAVAGLVGAHGGTPEMVAAAHLHDVLEDVALIKFPDHEFGYEAIRRQFGDNVLRMVWGLTDYFTKENYPQHNRAARKDASAFRLQWAFADVQTIKLADLIDNAVDIGTHDHAFAVQFHREARHLLQVLTKGDEALRVELNRILNQ